MKCEIQSFGKGCLNILWAVAVMALLGAAGCKGGGGSPTALPVDKIPAELEAAYAKSSAEIKSVVAEVGTAIQNTNYPAAYVRAQSLIWLQEATPEQRMVNARLSVTLTGLLREAEARGDQQAAAALRVRRPR